MAFRLSAALALAATAWSCGDEAETCRCTAAPELSAPEPPELDPSLVPSEPLDVRAGHVSSVSETLRGEVSVHQSVRGSSIELRPSADGEVCVAGELALVPEGDRESYSGAQLELSLREGEGSAPGGWERGDVVGIAFDLRGTPPVELRLAASSVSDPSGTSHCIPVAPVSGFTLAVRFDQLVESCWNGPRGKPLPEGRLAQFGWDLPASSAIAADFAFCVENLRLLRERAD